MNDSYPFLTLEQPWDEAIAWVSNQVSKVGLQVVRTFDFQTARHDPVSSRCPLHGAEPCDCQIVVLLVYGGNLQPISLVARGFDGQTWFSLVDTPQQRADPDLESSIRNALRHPHFPTRKVKNLSRAA